MEEINPEIKPEIKLEIICESCKVNNTESCSLCSLPPKPKFNQKDYTNKYYQDHKAYWFTRHICKECGGKYLKANESRHRKTGKHLRGVQKILDMLPIKKAQTDEILDNLFNKFDSLSDKEISEKYDLEPKVI